MKMPFDLFKGHFFCINNDGKIDSFVFLGLSKYDIETNQVETEIEFDSAEDSLKLVDFKNYLSLLIFSPATNKKKNYSCKSMIIFESKQI